MNLYLYGTIRHDRAIEFGSIGFAGAPVRTVPCGPFAAIVGSAPGRNFKGVSREELVKLLLSHQGVLETVMKEFFVLPFKFGTIVKDETELREILKGGESLLSSLEKEVKDSIEIDLLATWEVTAMLRELSEEEPEIAARKKATAQSAADRAFVGMLLAHALKRRADRWRRKIMEALGMHSASSANHELLNDTMVLNASFLVPRDGAREFYRTLEALDAAFEKKLNFKCVGPLPPYSFATVTLQRFDPQDIQGAARILGLSGKVEPAFVKKAYKELSRRCHPDTDPNLSAEKFAELNRAYGIVADYCEAGQRSLAREAIESSARLKVMENTQNAE